MPTHDLYAAVWKVKPAMDLSLDSKKANIKKAMTMAYGSMLAASQRMKAANPVYLFCAPEYYWTKKDLLPCSEAEKKSIYASLLSESTTLSNLLMFPGTVNWQKPLAQHTGPAPANLGKKQSVAYNTAPVYLGGVCLLDYYKKYNDTMIDTKAIAAFSAGTGDAAQSFSARGLRFGLDVCGDLNKGQLNNTLQGGKVDAMILLSGSISHGFGDAEIGKIPVREGGAFIHCDDSGADEKNGLWAISLGKGWHGSAKNEFTLAFDDLDNKKLVIAFPIESKDSPGPTMKVTAVGGFGPVRTIDATVIDKRLRIKKFKMTIPGPGRTQTAEFEELYDNDWQVKLSRSLSPGKVRKVKPQFQDVQGVTTTGRGNVSKIGKLYPAPNDADLSCYHLPIV